MTGEGFVFPGVVRALLDQCTTAEESVQLMRSIPVADYRNFLISDAQGNIALVETAGTEKAIQYHPAADSLSASQLVLGEPLHPALHAAT